MESTATQLQARLDSKRLDELVTYSAMLRPQMWGAAAFLVLTVWHGGQSIGWALLWMLQVVVVREVRAAWLLRLRKPDGGPMADRLKVVTWLSLALGGSYGSIALFMPGLPTEHDAILSMLLLSLGAGAITTTFTVVPAFVAFGAGLSVPLAIAWAVGGGWPGVVLGVLILLLFQVQVRFANRTFDMFRESFQMAHRNTELVEQLSREREHLKLARDAAMSADVSKSRFLASASHDLRQPLQSLVLNCGALVRRPLDDTTGGIATDIKASADALGMMLDGLLDVSQLDSGAVNAELQTLRLHLLLQGATQRVEGTARAKGLDLRCNCSETLGVISDSQMLQRIVSNLLDNALKFTVAGGVRVDAIDLGSRVRVTVADTGIGIAPEDHDRVFDDLVQLSNPQRDRARGHGLGLGIVRRLCGLLGIEVSIESALGAGTSIHLDLPPAGHGTPVIGGRAEASPGLVARRLLVVDDDAAVRSAYANSLSHLGCEVQTAADLPSAILLSESFKPEVALVDFRLAGETNGIEVCSQLRRRDPAMLAILVSADTGPELRNLAAREALPTLRKPVSDSLLALTINRLLSEAKTTAPARGAP
jgi:two-component system, sensor histidine kinase